ncbi:MAG: hypothetical protein AAGG50_06770 [Bacteroidota bacterium]
MRWLFYFPKPRSRDGLLRRRPVWPRRLIRRGATPYARRRFDHAEVGQLAYHVTLIVLLLFGCRMGTLVTMTLSESPWALQEAMQLRGIERPILHHRERPEQKRLVYRAVLNKDGHMIPFPRASDSLAAAVCGFEFTGFEPIELTSLRYTDYDPTPRDSMTARQRFFSNRLNEEPRMILSISADRRTPMDSMYAFIHDARVAGVRRFMFMGVPPPSPSIATQP